MGLLGSVAESVREFVPGARSEAELAEQAAEQIADEQDVPVGYFRCEECGHRQSLGELAGTRIVETPKGNTTAVFVCYRCADEHGWENLIS